VDGRIIALKPPNISVLEELFVILNQHWCMCLEPSLFHIMEGHAIRVQLMGMPNSKTMQQHQQFTHKHFQETMLQCIYNRLRPLCRAYTITAVDSSKHKVCSMTHHMMMKHVWACTEVLDYGYLAIKHCLILYATKDDASCPCPVIVMNLLHLPFLQCTTFCLDLKLSATRIWRHPYLQHCLQALLITHGTESTCEERNRSRLGENKMHVAQTLILCKAFTSTRFVSAQLHLARVHRTHRATHVSMSRPCTQGHQPLPH
jgi:hypothetical protein